MTLNLAERRTKRRRQRTQVVKVCWQCVESGVLGKRFRNQQSGHVQVN